MFTRPKPGDDEDDILAMQDAYIQEKEKNKEFKPSAQVINLRKHKSPEQPASSQKQSKYAQSKGLGKKSRVSFNEDTTVINDDTTVINDDTTVINDDSAKEKECEVEDDKVYFPTALPSILGDIVEKKYDQSQYEYKPTSSGNSKGFPSPRKRMDATVGEYKSLQDLRNKLAETNMLHVVDDAMSNSNSSDSKISSHDDSLNMSLESVEDNATAELPNKYFEKSAILQGDGAMDIHQENVAKIKGMSQEEILKEQKTLMDQMDPKLVEYMKSLRSKRQETIQQEPKRQMKFVDKLMMTSSSEKVEDKGASCLRLKDVPDNNVIQNPDLKKWLHFDTLEVEKLQWMHNMEQIDTSKFDVKEPYEARFNFKGYLQPYTDEYTEKNKILFHHGEDPHRPGYSLSELFQLARSTVTQQRTMALHTIAGILEYHSIGAYDKVIDLPITKIFFVLRFALDENIVAVLEPTLKALRNMFYNKIDEICLDFLLNTEKGLVQPRLVSTKSEKSETDSDVSELKDFHLVELDLVNGAIRTDLIPRLRYILTTVKPSFLCKEYCLEIFTRIFRDSEENAKTLFNADGLMEFIFENYLPKCITLNPASDRDMERCKIILDTLKMIRIAVCQSKNIADTCFEKYNIFPTLLSYIGNVTVDNTIILKIQTEAFYLWSCFLNYGIGMSCMSEIKGLLLRLLDEHSRSTDLSSSSPILKHAHVAGLITLLRHARLAAHKYPKSMPDNYFDDFMPIMMFAFQKWSSQIGCLMSYNAGHLKSVSALLTFMSTCHELEFDKFSKITEINTYLQQMFQCDGFLVLSSNLIRNSNLLSTLDVENYSKKVTETNTPNLGAAVISKTSNVLPLVSVTSSISFLVALSKYILITKNSKIHSEFIQHNVMMEYIRALGSAPKLNLSDNWFTKIELDMMCNIIYLSVELDVSDIIKEILYSFAFKLTYILSEEYKPTLLFLMERIVFNKDWFTAERLLRNLSIEQAYSILNHLKDIFECYRKALNLESNQIQSTLTLTGWNQKVLPRDWIFLPILSLYSKSHEWENLKLPNECKEFKDDLVKHIVTCSLKWILVSEVYFPEITNEISLTDRFCRLCCVFLCNNSLFLEPTIKPLLRQAFRIIYHLENSPVCFNKLNFDKSIMGINNFQDFYMQLVDQFQAVSYGDPQFASCILVPLAQKHDVRWRKLIWSEYAACLRALDCPKEYLCYRLDRYLDPPELDFSLLKCYHNCLNSNLLRQGTVVHQIAQTHVEYAKIRQRQNKTKTNSQS